MNALTMADQPMTVLEKVRVMCVLEPMILTGCDKFQSLDLACVETQIGDGSGLDCEILEVKGIKLQLV